MQGTRFPREGCAGADTAPHVTSTTVSRHLCNPNHCRFSITCAAEVLGAPSAPAGDSGIAPPRPPLQLQGCISASTTVCARLPVGSPGGGCSVPGELRDGLCSVPRKTPALLAAAWPPPHGPARWQQESTEEAGRLRAALPGSEEEPASRQAEAGLGRRGLRAGWGGECTHSTCMRDSLGGILHSFSPSRPRVTPWGRLQHTGHTPAPEECTSALEGQEPSLSKCLAPGALFRLLWHKWGSMFKRHSCL